MNYDVIVVGCGHNGVVAGFYLARAGLRVLVLERGEKVGGMASTDELIPGFHFTTYGHSFVLFHTEILDDKRLLDYVLQIDSCDPRSFQPFRSGKPCPANIREGAPMLRIQPLPDRASTVAGANRFSPASHAARPPDRHSGKTVRRSAHRGGQSF